jgi:hypothetical protein
MNIKWNVDFSRKVIGGQVSYRLNPVTTLTNQIVSLIKISLILHQILLE